jgi:hypothetical protein
MYEEETEVENSDDKTCQNCGLRQYTDVCVNCNIPIEEEKEKTPDDDDEYDRRERR